jgi:hypothetical protein
MGVGGKELWILFFFFVPLILCIIALVDITKGRFGEGSNKLIWVLIVLLLPLLGSILYFSVGQKQKIKE